MLKKNTILIHVFGWAMWILSTLSVNSLLSKPANKLATLANFVPNIVLFYVMYALIYKRYFRQMNAVPVALLLVALGFPIFHVLRISLLSLVIGGPNISLQTYYANDPIAISLAFYIQYAMFSFAYWIAQSALKRQKRIIELEQENHRLEKQQLITELNFIKAQINPHFLYNTLNALYAQARPHSDHLADNIMKLSDIMRYSLESVDFEQGTVQLRKELEHLRFSNTLCIDFSINGHIDGHVVPPLSLITAVENAFKYGDLKDPSHPVKIKVDIASDLIHFYCFNKKKKGSIEKTHGIGIDNMKRRLDVAFQHKYELKTKNEPEYYTFELTVVN
jgi:two-component system, LytTR family, sensor kinase